MHGMLLNQRLKEVAMIEKIRRMLLDMFQRQMKSDSGISTRISLYMVEVQLLKEFQKFLKLLKLKKLK